MNDLSEPEFSADSVTRILTDGGAIDLSERAKFRLTGGDRARYLSGQMTQAVTAASHSKTAYACVTNHKGKLEGDLFFTSTGPTDTPEGFLIDIVPELRESLFARLDRYIIADDAELTDVTPDWHLIHIIGGRLLADEFSPRACDRYGIPGTDYWIPATIDVRGLLTNIPIIDRKALDVVRIMNGISQWGSELSPDILPPEAKLEARAISYTKGCYIGQEVISRIRSVGRVNRTLERIESMTGTRLAPGMILATDEGKQVGQITSAAFHPAHADGPRWIGLAFIRRGASDPGTRLTASDSGCPSTSPPSDADQIMLSSTVEVRNTADHQQP
ncbi:MAG: hypothetical protein O3C21_07265 [Verrucomicrobia bacterium]|nr:hypothetical protein [Verrucomicrobiota bacterium]